MEGKYLYSTWTITVMNVSRSTVVESGYEFGCAVVKRVTVS
jgi:hypothetical protein